VIDWLFCFVPWDSSPLKKPTIGIFWGELTFQASFPSKSKSCTSHAGSRQGSSRRLEAEANSGWVKKKGEADSSTGKLCKRRRSSDPWKLTWNLKNPTLEDDFPIERGSMYTYVYTQFLCSKWNWSKCFKWNGMQQRWRFVLGYKWSFTYFSRSTWMFQIPGMDET